MSISRRLLLALPLAAAPLLASALLPPVSPPRHGAQGEIAIVGATVLDMVGDAPLSDATVLVRGGRIAEVGPRGGVRVPAGAARVDGRGKFVIPGMWDLHVHLTSWGEGALPMLVAGGVTGVRDMGGDLGALDAWRSEIARGARVGPRILRAGPILESERFVRFILRLNEDFGFPPDSDFIRTRIPVSTPERARAVVDSLAALGVDHVKFRTLASPDVFRALAAASRAHGLPLVGHTPFDPGPAEAVAGGLATVEHSFFPALSPARRDSVLRAMREHGTEWVPTLVPFRRFRGQPIGAAFADWEAEVEGRNPHAAYVPAAVLRDWEETLEGMMGETPLDWAALRRGQMDDLRAFRAADVPILVGTDVGALFVYPGFSLHDELALLVDSAGLTPLQALRAATAGAARALGLADSVGTVAPGQVADLVVLDADPLVDIRGTRRIHAVVSRGRLLDRARLDALLADARRFAAREPRPPIRRNTMGRTLAIALEPARFTEFTAAWRAWRADPAHAAQAARAEDAVNFLGLKLLDQSRPADAAAVFRLNLEAFPRSALAHEGLGDALRATGDPAGAAASYRRALEADAQNTRVQRKLREVEPPAGG